MSDSTQKDTVRVLALNGGGVRGLFTISVLAEIERVLSDGDPDVSIGSYFDLIAGTSIGGILALGLADGRTARELEKSFRKQAPTIFPKNKFTPSFIHKKWKSLCALFGHRYDGCRINAAVESILGKDRTIRGLKRRVLIPTVNLTTGHPYYIKTCHNPRFTRDDQFNLVDVARATSAAPTYFSPHFIEAVNAYFVDGGLVANNPSYVAYHEVMTDLKDEFNNINSDNIKILNIGTLSSEFCVNPENIKSLIPGYIKLWGVGQNLIETVMTSNQLMHGYMAKRIMNLNSTSKSYFELDDAVPNEQAGIITLDNASDEALKVLSARGKQVGTYACSDSVLFETFFSTPAPAFVHPKDR